MGAGDLCPARDVVPDQKCERSHETGATIAVSTRTAGVLIGRAPFDEKHVARIEAVRTDGCGSIRSGENDVLDGVRMQVATGCKRKRRQPSLD
jgi:hypothetical protein